jgi:hypothetical protein
VVPGKKNSNKVSDQVQGLADDESVQQLDRSLNSLTDLSVDRYFSIIIIKKLSDRLVIANLSLHAKSSVLRSLALGNLDFVFAKY